MCTLPRAIALPALLLLGSPPTVLSQTEAPPAPGRQPAFDLSVDVSDRLAGRRLDDILRGAVRVRWDSDGPRLFVSRLAFPPRARRSAAPAVESGCLVLSRYDHSTRNRLGGGFFAFDRDPSTASAELTSSHDGERVLRFDYAQEDPGFAGLVIQLHDPAPLEDIRHYLDARAFDTLSLLVRGHSGKERVRVRLADAGSNEREVAHELGDLADYLDARELTPTWQRAVIDLEDIPWGVNRAELDKVVLLPAEPGAGTIEINDVQLCGPGHRPSDAGATPGATIPERRALWVWSTTALLADPSASEHFLAFLQAQRIDTVYLQLPDTLVAISPDVDPGSDTARLSTLLRRMHARGVSTLALDGAAHYALPEHHDIVLRTIRHIIRYNAAVDPAERFAGVHYDVEPYLLDEYVGAGRWPILRSYLRLLERAGALTRAAGLVFEVAIPFWFDTVVIPPPAGTGSVTLRPLSEQVIDRTDSVAIMDYRTFADGPNGTLAHGESELEYASILGRRVMLGLETTALPDRDVYNFYGRGLAGLPPELQGPPAETDTTLWVVAVKAHETTTLRLLGRDGLERLRATLAGLDDGGRQVYHWEILVHVPVPASGITFHDLGPEALHDVVAATRASARRHPAFGGIALHYYTSYRRLLEQGRRVAPAEGTAAGHRPWDRDEEEE